MLRINNYRAKKQNTERRFGTQNYRQWQSFNLKISLIISNCNNSSDAVPITDTFESSNYVDPAIKIITADNSE